ncbi:MAG: peptidoglycan editing factor PgeF [bacterium]|nr:peptidoglycan editing factor PgeF [bacterium]
MFRKDSRNLYLAVPFERFAWLEHGFGTRHDFRWPDSWIEVTLRQVHSNQCVVIAGTARPVGEGDALLTDRPGLLLGVRGADCLPILILEERRRVVAAVHAGWRGTVAGVAAQTVDRMVSEFGADPRFMYAAIGPGIGACCYEVGPEVACRFRELFPERDDLDRTTRIDLAEANRRQLVTAGLSGPRIDRGAPCTCCGPKDFFSYRRTPDETRRMVSVIGLRRAQE